MDAEICLDDFTDFTFEDYALETEVKSEESEAPSDFITSLPYDGSERTTQQRSTDVGIPSTSTSSRVQIPMNGDGNDDSIVVQNAPDNPETCLLINQNYQRFIVEQLTKLQLALSKNREEQDALEAEKYAKDKVKVKTNQRVPKYLRPINLFAAPYFRDARGMVPPDNEDTKLKRKNHDVDAYLTQSKPFCTGEYEKLLTAVKENVRTLMMEPHKAKRDHLKNKLKFKLLPKEEEDVIVEEIENHEDRIETLKNISVDNYLKDYEDKIDWLTVSAAYMEGRRTADECEYLWHNYLNPSVNKDQFTPEEDEKLARIAGNFDYRDWDDIARELDTNRTAIQCFERYQSHLNTKILKKYWTKEEDEKLKSVIDSLKVGNYIPWHKVVLYMDGRTRLQITNRWCRTAAPESKRGPWSVGEDALLCAAVKKYGNKSWKKIKDVVPGRCNYICRERYTNMLAGGYKVGEWTPEEDRLLIELTRKYKFGKWSKICRHFSTRTDNMCLQRATRLKAYNPFWFTPRESTNEYDEIRTMGKYDDRIAPSSTCNILNKKRYIIKNNAEQALLAALRKITKQNIKTVKDVDLTDASQKFMNSLKEELLKDEDSRSNDWKPRYGMFNRSKPRKEKRNTRQSYVEEPDSPDDEEEDSCSEEDGEQENSADEKYYDDVLDSLLKPRVILKSATSCKGVKALTAREWTEYSILKKSIFESYKCSPNSASNDEKENASVIFDYAESMARVLPCFVLPPVEPNQFQVFPPNDVNLTGMDIFRSIRFSAIKSAAHIERSQTLFQVLSSETSSANLKCVVCLKKMDGFQDSSQSLTQKSYMVEMRKDFEVVDETLKKAIDYEVGKSDLPAVCNCDAVLKMKQGITLLRKRFVSMFLWPWLLTSSMPNEEQKCLAYKRAASDLAKKRKAVTSLLQRHLTDGFDEKDEDSLEKCDESDVTSSSSNVRKKRRCVTSK